MVIAAKFGSATFWILRNSRVGAIVLFGGSLIAKRLRVGRSHILAAVAVVCTWQICSLVSADSPAVITTASAQTNGLLSNAQCKKPDPIQIRIGPQTFAVPRAILATVTEGSGRYNKRWQCNEAQIDARSFYIFVTKNAGPNFYKSWIGQRKLPVEIEILKNGLLVNFTSKFLAKSKQAGVHTSRDKHGFDVTKTKSSTYYDASPLGVFAHNKHKVVFLCSNTPLQNAGRHCRVSYPFDDLIDVSYGFYDRHFPITDWIGLDARFREFVKNLQT